MPPSPKPRRIEYVSIDELPDAPTNAKAHASALIDDSLTRFGVVEPITLDERTGRIVSGHGRKDELLAKRDRGEAPPEGVVVDRQGHWLAPVVRGWSSVDDAEAEAAGVALNRVGEAGGWHDDVLAETLQRLAELPSGFAGLGYDGDDLKALLARIAPEPEQHTDPDEVPETPKVPVTKPGDMWVLGGHTVCPDCGHHNEVR